MSEDVESIVAIFGVIGAIGALAAIVAAIKGRSSFGWLIASLVFPPLLLVLSILPSLRAEKAATAASMPSWAQSPGRQGPAREARAETDPPEALQQALARAGARVESDVGKRIVSILRNRAAASAQRPRQRRSESRPERRSETREERAVQRATVQAGPRTGAVQRTGRRETVIYRRT